MFYKVKSVKSLPDMKLLIQFENEVLKTYDIKQLLSKYKNFAALKDDTLFNLVKVDSHGYGIYWNDYIDISCNELWYNGQEAEISIIY